MKSLPIAMRLRSPLAWALLVSVLATVWALSWPKPVDVSPAGEFLTVSPQPRQAPVSYREGDSSSLRVALGDPFFPRALSTAKNDAALSSTSALADAQPAMPVALPPPPPPHIAGSFTGPEGEESVFVSDGGHLGLAKPGRVLSSGYEVEAAGPRGLRLRHPAASAPVVLPMPAAPVPGTLP